MQKSALLQFLKKYWQILLPLVVVKLTIQLLGNRNYGFHRDELLHLSVSEHLAWGYMEFPPFIAWIGRLSDWFFVAARIANDNGASDVLWVPGANR